MEIKNSDKIIKRIGKTIKFLRESRNLTQSDFSFKVDMNTTYLSDIERGRRKHVSVIMLIKIADGLEVTLNALVYTDFEK